jgi:hypothetical protein
MSTDKKTRFVFKLKTPDWLDNAVGLGLIAVGLLEIFLPNVIAGDTAVITACIIIVLGYAMMR